MAEKRITLSPGVERLVRAAAVPPTCSTCTHWQAADERDVEMAGIGRCDGVPYAFDTDCDGSPAFMTGGYDGMFGPELFTDRTFGCRLHEPIPAAPDPEDPQP